ncbi:26S proteasome non-ATPase regulatory subunit 2-like isoform X2 [Anthonomus grandis grandis]|uniref:26S proteasome non-ATPase regulatory subunit 2-like isoform X2 n=1 Tax=Anthonomus grandis grandis TaxID=2921223 RepID=UPI002166A5E9|nr:26S proteasome non-ATPase regulatory subunit 2-like isoform X2 [Anthonomus grandis grandis]
MAATTVQPKPPATEEPEEDKELQNELKLLVDKITGTDPKLILPALEMLKYLIRTSTTSMTSVPKPLKYLTPYYELLKDTHKKMPSGNTKHILADVISVLAMGTAGGEEARKQRECLKYCLIGTMKNIGDWGHEYIRQLENEIVQQWVISNCGTSDKMLMPLINDIIKFNCEHHAEIQACDLLMEIDQLSLLPTYIGSNTYQRMCYYLISCARYVDDMERDKIMTLTYEQYLKFDEYSRALIIALQMNNAQFVNQVFSKCTDRIILCQLAFICARQLFSVELDTETEDYEDLNNILSNSLLSSFFHTLCRELDVMEPKMPEDVYKTWLEPVPPRLQILGENMDSARQNLASSFVNGFVNAAFGIDKLLTEDTGNKWIYRNKDHGMLSATAALGLVHLWDVDGGLTPIDKYLYTTEDYIKSGALLALGIVNCRVRNECDPALALLGDYILCPNELLQIGSVLGLGIAYAGSQRDEILSLLLPVLTSSKSLEILANASIACGLVSLGKSDSEVPSAILNAMIELHTQDPENLKSVFMKLMALGVALCYFGARDDIDVSSNTMEVFPEPFKSFAQTTLLMCSYAGTGDVLIIQELLAMIGEKVESPNEEQPAPPPAPKGPKKAKKGSEWDYAMGQAVATLAVASVSFGEDIGMDMVQRIFGNLGRYGEPSVRKAVPLAIALSSVSNPQLPVLDVLTKYSHDIDDEVACLIGAGTNNARLAAGLRQLAVFHAKSPSPLFMVRVAQGLVHLGKGTLTLNPMHTDRMLLDPVGMAGLLITAVSLLEPHSLILAKCHYLLYSLTVAIQPRWLLTLDEKLEIVPTTVRVGQAVDVVGKAGTPKTIAGIHTHSTPVLLAAAERAELATDQYEHFAPTLDGICVLKKNPEAT